MGKKVPANDGKSPPSQTTDELLLEIETLRAALSEHQRALAELEGFANRDSLVDLHNRRAFMVELERAIGGVRNADEKSAIIFADVDGLKPVNDKYGHLAGDKVLQDVASLIKRSAREADCVARLAGDEFAVLLRGTDELGAWQLALRIVEAVDDHECIFSSTRLTISLAVGVAAIHRTDTPTSALARADQEMYRIKAIGPRSSRP